MDIVSKATRSRVMSRIRGTNTGLEGKLEALLSGAGLKGYVQSPKHVLGKPDFVFGKKRVAVFLDSCFWHGCPRHLRMPKSNLNYWTTKIERNKARDSRQRRELRKQGWRVVKVWEHELKHPARVLAKLTQILTRLS
jgi:DNA mismatch endonuclease, patch repair protein